MGLRATKEAARFDAKEFSLAPTRHVTFLLCIVSLMCLNTVTLASSGESVGQYHPRYKRNLLQLCDIMSFYTGKNCLDYNGHGHYCGLGGSGKTVDDVDKCCRSHDRCYAGLSNICSLAPHLVTYAYRCTGKSCSCTNKSSSCEYKTCRCDVVFGECLKTCNKHKG
ncbi:hypothetical protein BsWGS_16288 [Bradybaena similaris]